MYDPYDLLVQVQNKNDMINRIESIPIVLDKNFMDMKKEQRKERPQTSKLKAKFNFDSKNDSKFVPNKKSTSNLFFIDEEIRKKREKEEEERIKRRNEIEKEQKRKEEERERIVNEGNMDNIDNMMREMDMRLNNMEKE